MNNYVKTALLTASLAVALPVFGAELVVTQADSASKSGRLSISLDLASDGDVTGFQFILRSSEQMKPGSVDVSKCLADLPKGFTGGCQQNVDGIYVSAMSADASALASGVVSVGSLSVPAELAKGALTVDQLEMIGPNAEVLSSSDQVVR